MVTQLPASIRFNNPGAMGLGKTAKRYGASRQAVLGDGESNTIAYFPTSVQGAAAQFALLANPKYYFGHKIEDAIATWSGANNPKRKNARARLNAYLADIEALTDWSRSDYIDGDILDDCDQAVAFAKAMAKHEAGRAFPMTDDEWSRAYDLYLAKEGGERVSVPRAGKPLTSMPWMDEAAKWVGEKEISGRRDNPDIMAFYADAGHPGIAHDETPWCAAFVSACLARANCRSLQTLVARDYEDYGQPLAEPEFGAIGVKWRGSPNSWQGHVGFVVDWTATKIKLRGGNQSNAVTEAWFPRREFSGFYMPEPKIKSVIAPEVIGHPSVKEKGVGLTGLIASLFALLYQWGGMMLSQVSDFLSLLFGALPHAAAGAQTAVQAGKSLADMSGLVWPVSLGLVIAAVFIGKSIWRTIERARGNGQINEPKGAAA